VAQLKVFLAGQVGIEAAGVLFDERRFAGRQGRLLLAYLATAAPGRPIPHGELAEVLWGDAPPATWDKALSVLVSKLRAVLTEAGIDGGSALTSAFGCYRLDLPEDAWVDVVQAESAVRSAESALAVGDLDAARESAALAESVLRLPFLPGDDGSWVEAKRREFADARRRALSGLAEAALRSGDATDAVLWAEREVDAEPFRESGYRRLMEAHAAAGNRAKALQVYERCRQFLAEELGTYPSPETETIYRGLLEAPSSPAAAGVGRSTLEPAEAVLVRTARRRRRPLLIGMLVVAAAVAVIAAIASSGGAPRPPAATTAGVALVVPRSPPGSDDPSAPYLAAIDRAPSLYGVRTRTFTVDLSKSGVPADVRKSLDDFGLVLLAGPLVDDRFADEIKLHPHTRFVVLDPDPNRGPIYDEVSQLANATDVFFVEGPGAFLAGYLSARMAQRRTGGKGPVVVSFIGGDRFINANQEGGFEAGVDAAAPGATVIPDYSDDFTHPAACARLANLQIDEGSTAVFADAGACSVGALNAAGIRGVWGIGSDTDMSYLGKRILVSTVKRLDKAVDYSIRAYLSNTLPQGHLDIGIERDAVGIAGINPAVPASIRAQLVQVQQQRIATWTAMATPLN
jgi:basic membrane lipoprotein Med (substrate-binding protein (PBP1-ABC) superfamily)/DNA-binding SARP family transcriptional activator